VIKTEHARDDSIFETDYRNLLKNVVKIFKKQKNYEMLRDVLIN